MNSLPRVSFSIRKTLAIPSKFNQFFRRGFARMLSDPENKGSQQRHVNFDTLGTWYVISQALLFSRNGRSCTIMNVFSNEYPYLFNSLFHWVIPFFRDNRIDFSLLLQQSIKHGKPIPKINIDDVGYASVLGRRTYNEDFYRYVFRIWPNSHQLTRHHFRAIELQPNSSSTSIMYFAIFDGHGGQRCAQLWVPLW